MFGARPDKSGVDKTCPDEWQTTKATVKDRCSFLFNNGLLSDIKFTVPVPGKSESKKSKHEIFAHKFLLSISSPVFYTMFYGAMPETRETVELPDCNYEVLVEFLRYIYCDEITLSESNVSEVLYMSKKYMMPPLADKCWEFLMRKEMMWMVWIFIPCSFVEPAYLIYRINKVAHNWSEDTQGGKDVLVYSFLAAASLAFIVRVLVLVTLKFVVSNFKGGLKETVFNLPVTGDEPPAQQNVVE